MDIFTSTITCFVSFVVSKTNAYTYHKSLNDVQITILLTLVDKYMWVPFLHEKVYVKWDII